MDRKEKFEQDVQKAVFDIADFMISKSIDGKYIGRSSSIKEALKLNIYVYNEAAGRLKAIGFMTDVKHFSKSEMAKRNDNEEYYYDINSRRHPSIILDTPEGQALLNKRRRKLDRKSAEEMAIFIDVMAGKYDFQDKKDRGDDE